MVIFLVFKTASYGGWKKIVDSHLLAHLTRQTQSKSHFLHLLLFSLMGSIIILVISGPSWQKQTVNAYQKQKATVIVLDLSENMLAKDIKPNRLARAKFKLQDILRQTKEGQTGLIVFSQEPFVVSPLSSDSDTLKTFQEELSPNIMPVMGTNIALALQEAKNLIRQAGFAYGQVILITASKANTRAINMAKNLAKDNISTSVLAVATPTGAPISHQGEAAKLSKLDEVGLKSLAQAGNGQLVKLTANDSDIHRLLQQTVFFKSGKKLANMTITQWRDEGRRLLWLLLPIMLYAFRRGFIESVVD